MRDAVRFGVLGPLQVTAGDSGEPGVVSAARLRALLAVLLWRANQPVPIDEVAELVWDGAPPSGAADATRALVMRLRRRLDKRAAARIVTRATGYAIEVSGDELDASRFEALTQEAGAAVGGGQWAQAALSAAQALALWRGAPLADVPSHLLRQQWVPHLEQLHVQALDWRIEADLHERRHEQLISELRDLTARHPLQERFYRQLMLALIRSGRQAEALTAYHQVRSTLVSELGTEPGIGLQTLYHQILRADQVLTAPQPAVAATPPTGPGPKGMTTSRVAGGLAPAVPRQLPAAAPDFTGRAGELAVLARMLDRAGADRPGTVVISAIGGTPGVGKTALAIHWAHQAAARFADGQLYVNLRGFDPVSAPAAPADVVRGFLDALGVAPDEIPPDLDARAGLYRSMLSGKQMLIVLDNARDEHQVRLLLPGSPGCVVIITSRSQLTGLAASNGARLLCLDVLTGPEARQMLSARLGAERAAAEPGVVGEIADLCGCLPLALAVAAARVAARPRFPLAVLAAELRNAVSRLDALDTADPTASVRTVFSWSYRELSPGAARMFRLLGLHPGPDIAAEAAASLGACSAACARSVLAELTGAHLLAEHRYDRHLCHDLLRTYATDLARGTDSDPDREAATGRLLDCYLHTAHAAARVLSPTREPIPLPAPRPGTVVEPPADSRQALAWFEAEQHVLLAIIALAAEKGSAHAWQIPWTMADFLDWQGRWNEAAAILQTALAAAARLGDKAGQAVTRHRMAFACARLADYDEARAHLAASLELCQQLGDRAGEARAYQTLSYVADCQGQHGEALRHGEQALRAFRATGNTGGQVVSLNDIGWCHAQLGDYRQARSFCQQALSLWRKIGDLRGEAHTWDTLGYVAHRLGQYANAVGCYQQALGLFRELKDRINEAEILVHIGDIHHAAGEFDQARDAWHQALSINEQLDHPAADEVRTKLATVGVKGST